MRANSIAWCGAAALALFSSPAWAAMGEKSALAVGAKTEWACEGPYGKSVSWTVVKNDNGMIRMEGHSDGKSRWLEKPASVWSTTLFSTRDDNDGRGVQKQSFDKGKFEALAELKPGTSIKGDVDQSRSGASWRWSYSIKVGDAMEMHAEPLGLVQVLPITESRWVYNGNYSSDAIFWVDPVTRVTVGWEYKDNRGTSKCKLTSFGS